MSSIPNFSSQSNQQMILELHAALENQCFFLARMMGVTDHQPVFGHSIATMEKGDRLFALPDTYSPFGTSALVLRPKLERMEIEQDRKTTMYRLLGSSFLAHTSDTCAHNHMETSLQSFSFEDRLRPPNVKVYLE
jgi:hypothetical protein